MSKTVLVADDDSAIVQLIKFNLELEGFEVIVAYDGLSALDLAKNTKPDLLILDIMMPKLDGWDVVSEVRRDEQLGKTPVVILTALSADNAVTTSMAFGADVHLSKPFEPEELLEIVHRLIGPANEAAQSPESGQD